ncbi:MAG TPA: cyclodeaminase/cyclohydrolase family protein [Candidatus Bathyarchaeia archaeon]|nr:cyclodeaminase/cyclohydrolase family protein [Candidatus Bathyarchaeia archaeon]
MKKFKNQTIATFLDALSQKTPVPGGGAVAALCAANAAGLLVMAARYSVDRAKTRAIRKRLVAIVHQGEQLRDRFLELMDLDAQAYMKVVKARSKDAVEKRRAKKAAAAVPGEMARLCQKAVDLAPDLVTHGSPYLLSDVEVAIELLYAAYQAAMINVHVNQS